MQPLSLHSKNKKKKEKKTIKMREAAREGDEVSKC